MARKAYIVYYEYTETYGSPHESEWERAEHVLLATLNCAQAKEFQEEFNAKPYAERNGKYASIKSYKLSKPANQKNVIKYTLEQVAHFDRCLVPNDFKDELIKVGLDEDASIGVASFIISQRNKGNMVGVMQVYQEFITCDETTSAINKVVSKFVKKFVN